MAIGYEVLYRKTFLFSEQLRTPQAEAIAATAYSDLNDSFENFQRNLQKNDWTKYIYGFCLIFISLS